MAQAVKASVPSRQGPIDGIALFPVVALVVASSPFDPVGFRGPAICGPDANALHPPDLFDGELGVQRFGEPKRIQPPDDFELGLFVGPGQGLLLDVLRRSRLIDTACIEADTSLTDPGDSHSVVGKGHHRGVGDGRSRAQEERSERRGRYRHGAIGTVPGDGRVVALDTAPFDVDVRQAVPELGQAPQVDGALARHRASVIRPKPSALPGPMPALTAARRASGSTTSSWPSNVTPISTIGRFDPRLANRTLPESLV